MNEEEFVKKLIPIFRIHFDIRPEAWSKNGKSRIDLILRLKSNPKYYFGIECKVPDKKKGEKIGRYLQQAIRYSESEFEVEPNVFKKIPILLCPALSINYFVLNEESQIIEGKTWYKDRHEPDNKHHSINSFIGSFGVGEVRSFCSEYNGKKNNHYKFMFSNWCLFSSLYGISELHYSKYCQL